MEKIYSIDAKDSVSQKGPKKTKTVYLTKTSLSHQSQCIIIGKEKTKTFIIFFFFGQDQLISKTLCFCYAQVIVNDNHHHHHSNIPTGTRDGHEGAWTNQQ